MKTPWLRWGLLIAACGLLAVLWGTGRWMLPWPARWLDVGGKPRKADAVVLLNGGMNTRPFVAAALVQGGWAAKILLSTVAAHPAEASGAIPSYFEISSKVLAYGGVPENRIVRLDCSARTTFDEAKAVAGYLADHPARRLMIVTEGPHTRRARWIFQRMLASGQVEIDMISAPSDEFDNENWWRSEAGFLFIASEYFKLFFYFLRYGNLGYEILAAAALVFAAAWFLKRRKQPSQATVRSLGA